MPVISIIMAFHRVTPHLRPAVRSVLDQSERDLELILVDNGTGTGLGALQGDGVDPRIRLVTHATNLGIAAAHNAAVALASGEFIALLDYDDIALPTRLEKQIAALRAGPDLGLVSCGAESIDENGGVTGPEFFLTDGAGQEAYSQFAAPVVTPAYTGRREVFVQVPYREEFTYGADFDFLARAAERYRFGGVPEVLLRYRHHPAQTTVQQAARIAAERCVARLLAARRRAGRAEGEDWRQQLRAAADLRLDENRLLRECAGQFLAEGLWVQTAYHARRSMVVRRSALVWTAAARLFIRAWWHAGAQRSQVARMFFLGPVRALRLRPR